MKEQTIILEFQKLGMVIRDLEQKLRIVASQGLNMRANYAILVKALELSGALTPEIYKKAIEELKKATDEMVPADPGEPVAKEEKNEPSGGAS